MNKSSFHFLDLCGAFRSSYRMNYSIVLRYPVNHFTKLDIYIYIYRYCQLFVIYVNCAGHASWSIVITIIFNCVLRCITSPPSVNGGQFILGWSRYSKVLHLFILYVSVPLLWWCKLHPPLPHLNNTMPTPPRIHRRCLGLACLPLKPIIGPAVCNSQNACDAFQFGGRLDHLVALVKLSQ